MASAEADTAPVRVRRWLGMLVAVLLPAVVLRSCVLTTYVIGSSSMEPTLQTDDHVLAWRTALLADEPVRWEIAVFDASLDPDVPADVEAVVKRVVGLPGEFVRIQNGDVLAGTSADTLRVLRKPDDMVRRLLVTADEGEGLPQSWSWSGPDPVSQESGGARLSAGRATYARTVTDGLPGQVGESVAGDTALAVTVGPGDGTLVLELREGADLFRARLPGRGGGGGALYHNLGGGWVAAAPDFPGLEPDQTVLMWNVDDGVRVLVDDELLLAYDYDGNADQTAGTPLHNAPSVVVEGGTRVLRRLAVLRDLYYTSQGTQGTRSDLVQARVPPGHVFLLGDFSGRSRDSRHFGPVPLALRRGRPFAVYRPAARARWLDATGLAP